MGTTVVGGMMGGTSGGSGGGPPGGAGTQRQKKRQAALRNQASNVAVLSVLRLGKSSVGPAPGSVLQSTPIKMLPSMAPSAVSTYGIRAACGPPASAPATTRSIRPSVTSSYGTASGLASVP